ncbi:hypothetical protein [Actinoplanes sp. NPDC051411]|uniref:hypothetical protein n=1 Tax=Actinoplanes sp. NPDC051411 TaxID=3155522 RepID=UPI00343674A4
MPGVISLGGDERWQATGWLFCWVVGFLAMNVEQQRLAADIDHVRADDSGRLDLGMFGSEADGEMRALLRDRLVPVAEERFPPTMCGRATALELLRDLARLASKSPVDRPAARVVSRTIRPSRTAVASF